VARLLLITHEFSMTGAAWQLFRLGTYLVERGHTVHVFVSPEFQGPKFEGPLRARFEASGMPVVGRFVPKAFDLAIANTIYAAPVLVSLVSRIRTVWWVHEGEIGLELFLKFPHLHRLFPACAQIVFQTTFQRDDVYRSLMLDVPAERVSIIPNGIEAHRQVEPMPRHKPLRIVCVGTICPRKQQSDLIVAVASLKRDDVECVLLGRVHVGFPPRILSIVQARPDVFRVLGEVDPAAVAGYYAGSDIFSLPSTSESQPLTALEAARHGLPLVLTDLPAYRDIWRHGHNCLTHPVGDQRILAGLLGMLLQDQHLRVRLGQAAAATAASPTYRFATMANAFEALIERLVGGLDRPIRNPDRSAVAPGAPTSIDIKESGGGTTASDHA
jgi:glycosyltransferase involved in cell wall biosynthesis